MNRIEILVPDNWAPNQCPIHNLFGLEEEEEPVQFGDEGPVTIPGLIRCFGMGTPHYFRVVEG